MDKSLLNSLKYMVVMINIVLTIVLVSMLLGFGLTAGTYINTRKNLNQLQQTMNTYTTNTQTYNYRNY